MPMPEPLSRDIRGVPEGEQLCRAAWHQDTDALCRLLWNGANANGVGRVSS